MTAYIEKTSHGYKIGTPYGRYTRNTLKSAVAFCRANGFRPVHMGVACSGGKR